MTTTYRIEGIKGYRVTIGKKKGSGFFNYIEGNKKTAEKHANNLKEVMENNFDYDLKIDIQAVDLKKCDIKYCNNLCEKDERYCLKCDDLMFEAQMEYAEMKKREVEDES